MTVSDAMTTLVAFITRLTLLLTLLGSAFAANTESPHPCGEVTWLDEIRLLQTDFEQERGKEYTRELLHATLIDTLSAVDAHLVLNRLGNEETSWSVQWKSNGDTDTSAPRKVADVADLRDLYRRFPGPVDMRSHSSVMRGVLVGDSGHLPKPLRRPLLSIAKHWLHAKDDAERRWYGSCDRKPSLTDLYHVVLLLKDIKAWCRCA